MAYCTLAQARSMFYEFPSGGTQITDAEITDWIDEESILLDARIKNRYRVPLLGAESLVIARVIVQYLVASRIFSVVQRSTGKTFKLEEVAYDKLKYDQGKKYYKDIKENALILSNSDLLDSPNKTYMTTNSDVSLQTDDEEMKPDWEKNKQQW